MPKKTYATDADAKKAHDALVNGLQTLKIGEKSLREAAKDISRATQRVVMSASTLHILKRGPIPVIANQLFLSIRNFLISHSHCIN